MSLSRLPLELVYHVLTHAVLCGLREGRVRWAANLLALSRSCYTILKPVLFQRTVLTPAEFERMVDFLKYCQLNGLKDQPVLGDVQELHILKHHIPDDAMVTEPFISALVPARLHTVRIPCSLFHALSNSPDFTPRSFDATSWWPSDIRALPPRALQAVTHMTIWFPDSSTWLSGWTLAPSTADMVSSILDLLPVLTHFALHHEMMKDSIPISTHSTDFYDETQYLDVFRAIFSREHIVKVVLGLFGIVATGKYLKKISKLLGSLRDQRLYIVVIDEVIHSMWDDMAYFSPDEARMGLTVWDMPCRQVYVDNDRDGVNCREGPSES